MSETEIIVRDIFGDSDESDDEFEGFDGEINEQKRLQNSETDHVEDAQNRSDSEKKYSDEENNEIKNSVFDEEEDGQQEQPVDDEDDRSVNDVNEEYEQSQSMVKNREILPELSDSDADSNDEYTKESKPEILYDFDLMLQRRKEMNSRKRKRKNTDLINDSDDLIAELIQDMKQAAEEDFELNRNRMTAIKKLKMLPLVESQLKKIDLREALLDSGILNVITDWLTRLPDGSLPNLQIREKLLKLLSEFNMDDIDRIKSSGIGKAVMYLYKHPKETKDNKKLASHLISNWSRPIFNLNTDFNSISRDQRERRDLENMNKFKRSHSDSGEGSTSKSSGKDQEIIRPGDKGWVPRARVPMPSMKDYVIRPKSTVEIDMSRISSRKSITRFEKHMRNFKEMKKINKMNRAISISIEGRKMPL
ncbi:Protein IWS1 -like protein [Sarcoptes scabiei]|uniref:Med26 domain containing protein n=1 Tax=Sarcoptes scabiei TaxID=52283 RepID=A0A132AHZ3_SARSC|nr:Protein IWS1 -like protein [Sarcoptes scabiei]KPM10614.1 Med26 domain containing protein [Sarcoptes scabiei]UXI20385.1 mutS protein 5-like [Sarcoptes scabiei]